MAQVAAMRKARSVSSLVTAVAAYPEQDSSSSCCSPVAGCEGWSSTLGRGRSRASSVTSLASSSSGDTTASFHVKTGLSTSTQLTVR